MVHGTWCRAHGAGHGPEHMVHDMVQSTLCSAHGADPARKIDAHSARKVTNRGQTESYRTCCRTFCRTWRFMIAFPERVGRYIPGP